jgi:hypothetical protein
MRNALGIAGGVLACLFSGLVLASYADDRAEIENLSNRYMIAVDAGDMDTVMAAWVDDSVLEWAGGVEKGKAAIRKSMSGFASARTTRIPAGATAWPRSRSSAAGLPRRRRRRAR